MVIPEGAVALRVKALLALLQESGFDLIDDEVIAKIEIARCIGAGNLVAPAMAPKQPQYNCPVLGEDQGMLDWARTAWFVVNGWHDPIEVDVGIPAFSCPAQMDDGRHRLAAAWYRDDEFILANCGGDCALIKELTT